MDPLLEILVPCVSTNPDFDAQCDVAVRPELVVVAFRGTRPTSMVDWATDLLADQIPFDSRIHYSEWGSVHEGFVNSLPEVKQHMSAALAKFDDAKHSLWITGHSVGGVPAMLAAALFSNLPGHPIDGVCMCGHPHARPDVMRSVLPSERQCENPQGRLVSSRQQP